MFDLGAIDLGNPINRASPLNRGIVCRYMYLPGQVPGGKFFDLAGNFDATVGNAPVLSGAMGRPGGYGSVRFGSGTGYYDVPITVNAVFTVSLWIFPTTTTGDNTFLSVSNYEWDVQSGTINIYSGGGGQDIALATGASTIAANKWHHITYVRTGDSITGGRTIYINGVSSVVGDTSVWTQRSNWTYGVYSNKTSQPYTGYADDLIWRNVALSTDEVLGVYLDSLTGYRKEFNFLSKSYFPGIAAAPATTNGNNLLLLGVG